MSFQDRPKNELLYVENLHDRIASSPWFVEFTAIGRVGSPDMTNKCDQSGKVDLCTGVTVSPGTPVDTVVVWDQGLVICHWVLCNNIYDVIIIMIITYVLSWEEQKSWSSLWVKSVSNVVDWFSLWDNILDWMRFQWQTVVSSSLNVTDKLGAIWTDTWTDSAECGTHLLLLNYFIAYFFTSQKITVYRSPTFWNIENVIKINQTNNSSMHYTFHR